MKAFQNEKIELSKDDVDLEEDDNGLNAINDCFIGREEIFTAIDNQNNKNIKVLYGSPGVGKSSIAREYGYRKRDEGSY